ncbi:unnamed protein product, partial [Mesorhabditis spiculigera]
MAEMVGFEFLKLTENQRTAVYHHLLFGERFVLRRVAKAAYQIDSQNILHGTTISLQMKETARNALKFDLGCPTQPMKLVHTDTTMPYWSAERESRVLVTIDSLPDQLNFINRLTASMPPHDVDFFKIACRSVGGCVRQRLDILRSSIRGNYSGWRIKALPKVLAAERQIADRQNSSAKLSILENSLSRDELPEMEDYAKIFEQVAHIRKVYFCGSYNYHDCWPRAMSIWSVLLQDILVKYPPLDGATRLTCIEFYFIMHIHDDPDHRLPEELKGLLESRCGPNLVVEIDKRTQILRNGYLTGGCQRFDEWRVLIAENCARGTAEFRQEIARRQRLMEINVCDVNRWKTRWRQ